MSNPSTSTNAGDDGAGRTGSRDRNLHRRAWWRSGGFVALLFAAAVGLAALPGTVAAFGRHGAHGGHGRHGGDGGGFPEWRMEKLLDEVEASDEQRDRIREIVETRKQSLGALHLRRGELHERVVELLTAEEIDRDALEALRAEQIERMAKASRVLADSLADVAEVLTPEQRVELARHVEERRAERRERRGLRHRHDR